MSSSMRSLVLGAVMAVLALPCNAARQNYDVRKIIEAFRTPHDDLTILCAHRGMRWNGTTENSPNGYFRAAQAGIECIETDIRLSKDGYVTMIHDSGLGRETDVGEQTGNPAYNPFTGEGYSPLVKDSNYKGFMENLHLRDDQGRVHVETVATLTDIVESIRDTETNVVLQLDFKDRAAVEAAYWALKELSNAAGVPANEWCIYKVQASWWPFPADFEAEAWVQDAFASGLQLAHIPVYQPDDENAFDVIASMNAFAQKNYTISAEIERRSTGGALQNLTDAARTLDIESSTFATYGLFFAIGDFVEQFTTDITRFDTGIFTLPDDIRTNGSVYVYQENRLPQLQDTFQGNRSGDGLDHRSDLAWIIDEGNNWIIADGADVIAAQLEKEGKRNVRHMLADCASYKNGTRNGWYRRHVRDFDAA